MSAYDSKQSSSLEETNCAHEKVATIGDMGNGYEQQCTEKYGPMGEDAVSCASRFTYDTNYPRMSEQWHL